MTDNGAIYACVVDHKPKLHLDALRWFAALTGTAGVSAANLIVHSVGHSATDVLTFLDSQGVQIRPVAPFDTRVPTCNKISAALALSLTADVEKVYVLTDADIAIARIPPVKQAVTSVAAKPVDRANPPLDVFRAVFGLAGLELPDIVDCDYAEHRDQSAKPHRTPTHQRSPNDNRGRTIAGNVNGGVYLVPGTLLPRLAAAWAHWAHWLLTGSGLGTHAFFTDQVAMAMALTQEGFEVNRLEREWNFPIHDWIPVESSTPHVIHYHDRVEPTGLITPTGVPPVDEIIGQLNEAISMVWHAAFPNETFWNWRYKLNPRLGSGIGSRGRPLKDKRRLLQGAATKVQPTSVLDVGCGDGEATRGLPLTGYTGLDVSEEAIRLARRTRPDGSFHVATVTDWPKPAELTICLDVLIHQSAAETYRCMVEALLHKTTRVLIVSGYERPPSVRSPMVHFHEPLSATIEKVDPTVSVRKLRAAHEITVFAVVKPPYDDNWPSQRRLLPGL